MNEDDPERALALAYAPGERRAGLAALLALDDILGQVLRTTREPLVGQMRLTWWHAALTALDTTPPPAEPVLQALAAEVLPRGIGGAQLAGMIDGWETLLEEGALDPVRLRLYAAQRGSALFEMAGQVLGTGADDPLAAAGSAWALADLAGHVRDAGEAAACRSMAGAAFETVRRWRWSRAGRPLGALALIARMNLAGESRPGSPRRTARLAWHRMTGR